MPVLRPSTLGQRRMIFPKQGTASQGARIEPADGPHMSTRCHGGRDRPGRYAAVHRPAAEKTTFPPHSPDEYAVEYKLPLSSMAFAPMPNPLARSPLLRAGVPTQIPLRSL